MLPEPLRIGSLFSGIGGLELGIQRGLAAAGVPTETIWQVEQNDYARAVLARHWPHAQRFEDVRDITAATVAPVDLLCGGFPCQDISTAGKGAGLAGEKSGLFFEMARIIRELVPRIVVMENVPAITTRGLDVVLGTLAALGYAARWGGLRASEVGAPHRRERWFCVAWLVAPVRGDGRGSGMADTNSHRHRAADKQLEPTSDDGSAAMQGRQAPLWQRCDCCEDYWCNRHQQHAHDCPCPSIEHLDIDPYAPESLADSDSLKKKRDNRAGILRRTRIKETWTIARHRSETAMADTDQQQWRRRSEQPEQGKRAEGCDWIERQDRKDTRSNMGRKSHGLPRELVAHRWPAPPGPQHAWEPPRTRPRQPHDRDRLKALGNAVVPQCAEIIGRWIGSELVGLR